MWDVGQAIPYVLTRTMLWDGTGPPPTEIFQELEDGHWRLMTFQKFGVSFYLGFSYISHRSAFIMYVFYAYPFGLDSNYRVKMYVEQTGTVNPVRQSFQGNVINIESMADLYGNIPQENPNYWIVPVEVMETFYTYTRNDEDEMFTVAIPLTIEEVLKTDIAT